MVDLEERGGDRRPATRASGPAGTEPDGTTRAAHTVFAQPWWLDAVAPGSWGESVVRRGDEIAARLPFGIKEKWGVRVLTQPPLTRFLGPWVRSTGGKPNKQLEAEKELVSELIDGLPRSAAFRQSFSPLVTNWLPFHWRGFEATTRYTYRIEELGDLDAVWGGFAHSVRNHVKKAQKQLAVRTDLGVDVLHGLYRQVFERQGLAVPVGADLLRRLDAACADHKVRTLLYAVDAQERVHSAAFILHEADQSYLLLSGLDGELRSSGAKSLLVWEAVQRAAAVSRAFDFAGSMIESVERFNRGFGARQRPYLHVHRTQRYLRPVLSAQDELRVLRTVLRRRASR